MKNIFIILFAVQLVSCSNNKKVEPTLNGSWRLHDVKSDLQKSDFDTEAESMQVVRDGAVLSLFNDGTYSYISGKGKYLNGKCKLQRPLFLHLFYFMIQRLQNFIIILQPVANTPTLVCIIP